MGEGWRVRLGWRGGQCGGVGGRSAVLSNVSCQFSLCLQSETASRKQGGCNRIKTVPRRGGSRQGGSEGVRGKGGRRENGQREGQARQHRESGGNNCLCGRGLIVHRSLAKRFRRRPETSHQLCRVQCSQKGGEVSAVFVGPRGGTWVPTGVTRPRAVMDPLRQTVG